MKKKHGVDSKEAYGMEQVHREVRREGEWGRSGQTPAPHFQDHTQCPCGDHERVGQEGSDEPST